MNKFIGDCKSDKSPIIHKFLSSSPLSPQNIDQLRQNIRQECKYRLKNKRRELFNKSRQDLEQIVSNEFQKISFNFKQEVSKSDLLFDEIDLKILQSIEQDILKEELDWFNEELTRVVEEYENIDDQCSRLNAVICPLCLGGTLSLNENIIKCTKCKNYLSQNMELETFRFKLENIIQIHQNSCSSPPTFLLVPNEMLPSLLLICTDCHNCYSL